MRRNTLITALAISASMSLAAAPSAVVDERDDEKLPPKIPKQTLKGCSADINRHTGEPHRHSREIARRLRRKQPSSEQPQ